MRQKTTRIWTPMLLIFGVTVSACGSEDDDPATRSATGGAEGTTGGVGATASGAQPGSGGNGASGGIASGGALAGGAGATASGAQPATGGATTGGVATGGATTGGVATGGATTGGAATGGAATGGATTGGAATGGATTGGASTGGASTGGAASGGASTGGRPGTNGIPWLHTEGNEIKDPEGNTVILRGVANISIGALEGWSGGVIPMIDRLTDEANGWYARVLRLAVYPSDEESFDNSELSYKPDQDFEGYYNWVLRPAIDRCAERRVYCIIDWHYIDDTTDHVENTTTFWSNVAPRFANDSHVLFELYNEPINAGDWPTVRGHMQSWYDLVRQSASDNLVLVGTPSWDQEIGESATNPVNGTNIAYVSHTYPMHWGWDEHRQRIQQAAAVHPVFATEWGFQPPSGGMNDVTGGTLTGYAQPWREFVDGLGLSWTAWVASATWQPPMFSDPAGNSLTEFGQFAKTWLSDTRDQDRPAGL